MLLNVSYEVFVWHMHLSPAEPIDFMLNQRPMQWQVQRKSRVLIVVNKNKLVFIWHLKVEMEGEACIEEGKEVDFVRADELKAFEQVSMQTGASDERL